MNEGSKRILQSIVLKVPTARLPACVPSNQELFEWDRRTSPDSLSGPAPSLHELPGAARRNATVKCPSFIAFTLN
jgi:hypothetical protein